MLVKDLVPMLLLRHCIICPRVHLELSYVIAKETLAFTKYPTICDEVALYFMHDKATVS